VRRLPYETRGKSPALLIGNTENPKQTQINAARMPREAHQYQGRVVKETFNVLCYEAMRTQKTAQINKAQN
jgi:hypothetical protein